MKSAWPNPRALELFGTDCPIVQAPMAGTVGADMVIAVCNAGGLGSLPCALLNDSQVRSEIEKIRAHTDRPFNTNFFCHTPETADPDRHAAWFDALSDYYDALGLKKSDLPTPPNRSPFDEAMCRVVEELKPDVVSFHFGLPDKSLLSRVKDSGCVVLSSATTVEEAKWLEENGADAVIAQGYEAGGHRGIFLSRDISTQSGTLSLLPQVVDAVSVPVIAAGGISDGRGIAAVFALGAAAAQIGTAYLFADESLISDVYRNALTNATESSTALTNVFSGRPARGLVNKVMMEIGPISDKAPEFPNAGAALGPLRAKAEQSGSGDFSSMWAGQSVQLGQPGGAEEITRRLVAQAEACLANLSPAV